jgi:phosphohistidine phosphatase
MVLYLVRHGRAEEARTGLRDEARALTDRGRRELRETLDRTRGVAPSRILTSPLRRARETADIVVDVFGCPEAPVPTRALVPDSTPEGVWAALADHGDVAELMLVGHQPLLGAVYAFLLGSPTLAVAVEPGSIGCIDLERLTGPPRAELCWLVSPD